MKVQLQRLKIEGESAKRAQMWRGRPRPRKLGSQMIWKIEKISIHESH